MFGTIGTLSSCIEHYQHLNQDRFLGGSVEHNCPAFGAIVIDIKYSAKSLQSPMDGYFAARLVGQLN